MAHDLSVVEHISDRVAVMYVGYLVEMASTEELYYNPKHPYTEALLSAAPIPDPVRERRRRHVVLRGEIPSPANRPSGCCFRTRCPKAAAICAEIDPPPVTIAEGHMANCHFAKV